MSTVICVKVLLDRCFISLTFHSMYVLVLTFNTSEVMFLIPDSLNGPRETSCSGSCISFYI